MTTWQALVSVALIILAIFAMIKLGEHWSFADARARDSEAWSYLKWNDSDLLKTHAKFVDLIANGKAKPQYLRSVAAITQAMTMRTNFAKKRIYHHAYTSIEIRPAEGGFDVFYVVEGSELASGREAHIGRLQPFTPKSWVLRPSIESSGAWTLDEDALAELLEKVTALNAGT